MRWQQRRRRRRGGGGTAAAAAALLLAVLLAAGPAAGAETCPKAGAVAAQDRQLLGAEPALPAPAPDPAAQASWGLPAAAPSPGPDLSIAQQGGGGGLPWALLFSDEFKGSSLDASKWSFITGEGYEYGLPGFANGEVQYYTNSSDNVRVENDLLIIQAQQAQPGDPYAATSGRITTVDKFSVGPTEQYPTVRVEARIKVPQGSALWPAFWMLPQVGAWANSSCIGCGKYGHWAASGELDVLESANDMRTLHGSLHYGAAYPGNVRQSGNVTLEAGSLADDYHIYAIEWEPDQIRWYLDAYNYFTAYAASATADGQGWWTAGEGAGPGSPFDTPFFLILNLAVGGPETVFTGGAPLGDTLAQPQLMMVDWVRVHGLPYALSKQQQQRRRR